MGIVNRSKTFYVERDKIQDYINSGDIDAYDVIYTTDTHENVVISNDLKEVSVNSRILRFNDTTSAETYLNLHKESYDGQIVSILYGGKYVAYIVNVNNRGRFYVTSLNGIAGTINYDGLGNRPITNLTGTLDDTVIVNKLDTGIYRINGQYKLSDGDRTTYLSNNSNIFLVNALGDTVQVKRISTSEIRDFTVKDKEVSSSVVPTTQWLLDQGYITSADIDNKIAALHILTKENVQEFVKEIVDNMLGEVIEDKIDEKFQSATEQQIRIMF